MIWNLWSIWIFFFYVFFCNIIKVNHFLYFFTILLHLISSFSLTRTFLVPFAYVSIESIDYIVLSSFKLKAILLISSVKKLCLSLLNLFYVFNIVCMYSLGFFQDYLCQFYFFLNSLFYSELQLLLNSFHNF